MFVIVGCGDSVTMRAQREQELGVACGDKGDYDKAIEHFTEAIRIDPKNDNGYFLRGIVWTNKEEYDKAIEDFTEAIRLEPGDAVVHYNRGTAWSQKGEYDKAIIDFTEAIRLEPGMHMPTTIAEAPGDKRANPTRPSRTSPKQFGWSRNISMPTTIAASLGRKRATVQKQIRTLPKLDYFKPSTVSRAPPLTNGVVCCNSPWGVDLGQCQGELVLLKRALSGPCSLILLVFS